MQHTTGAPGFCRGGQQAVRRATHERCTPPKYPQATPQSCTSSRPAAQTAKTPQGAAPPRRSVWAAGAAAAEGAAATAAAAGRAAAAGARPAAAACSLPAAQAAAGAGRAGWPAGAPGLRTHPAGPRCTRPEGGQQVGRTASLSGRAATPAASMATADLQHRMPATQRGLGRGCVDAARQPCSPSQGVQTSAPRHPAQATWRQTHHS